MGFGKIRFHWWMVLVFLTLAVVIWSEIGYGKTQTPESDEAETEELLDKMEKLQTSLNQMIDNLQDNLKEGVNASDEGLKKVQTSLDQAVKELEALGKNQPLEKTKSKVSKKHDEYVKTIRKFVKKLSNNVLQDVNETVKRLNKMSEEIN